MDDKSFSALQKEIAELEQKLAAKKRLLEEEVKIRTNVALAADITDTQVQLSKDSSSNSPSKINNYSPPEAKITLFRSLFKGREDIYALRFESSRTGKSGYQPVCRNEWVQDICRKPKINCSNCTQRSFEPVTNEAIRYHLEGYRPSRNEWAKPVPFVMGIYPLLQNETCHFLAIDFDKNTWQEDAMAYMAICGVEGIPAVLERSRSGNGAHIWIFFDRPVLAAKARSLGSFLMTRTLDQRPEIGLESFDRFFPNQDTLPKGGFGNLIALPLQKAAREKNHSIFLDETMLPYIDQWAFLASIKRVDESMLDQLIQYAGKRNELLPVVYNALETDEEIKPWLNLSTLLPVIAEPLPKKVEIVLANQIYINHTGLPSVLRNRILRIASFANPEFYRAQKMRLPTWNKPRILCCYEFFPEYIGLPIGCMESLTAILEYYTITPEIDDKQNYGQNIDVQFQGELREDQKKASVKLIASKTGILSASTAFGKTVLAIWMIAERKVNTLILVHRKIIADQWANRINQFLGIPKNDIGYYSGTKKKRTGIIDIVVMQSIVKKDTVADWVTEYGQIIVDECHHISAASFERIIRNSSAAYRLGLTATIVRKDGQHPIVLMNLGDVRYSGTNTIPVFAQKVFLRFTDFNIPSKVSTTESTEIDIPPIQEIFHNLCTNDSRNGLIIQDILTAHLEGRECLILSERLEHIDILKNALEKHIAPLFVLKGGMGKKQIIACMEAIHKTPPNEHKIILATGKYLGEGFDLPSLDTLFLVFPFSWKGMLIQYTGRLNRTFHGKKEIRVYDYVDNNVPALSRMYRKRLSGYKALGFTVE